MMSRTDRPAPEPTAPVSPAKAEPAVGQDAFEHDTGAFFRRVDWLAFWTVFVGVLAAYTYTLAPTVTLEDSGELAVASDYLGVPHPPGYPSWTLITWFFQWIFNFVTFHGHPNPAWGVAFCSAFFGAAACALLAMVLSRSGADVLQSIARFTGPAATRDDHLFCWVGGVAGGLLLAFSPCMWSQSVIVEVYSLNTFFQSLIVLLLYRWMVRPREVATLYLLGFAFGLGLTNHQTLMFMGGAIAIAILARDTGLFRDFVLAGVPLLGLLYFNAKATMESPLYYYGWLSGPAHPAFWVHSTLFLVIPLLAWAALPRGRTVMVTILLFYLGLSFYAYLPFAAEQNPPMNWAYPRTWEGFLHAIGRGQYERISPGDIFSVKLLDQVIAYLSDLRRQFTMPVAAVGFLPFAAWSITYNGRRRSAFIPALVMAAGVFVLVTAETLLHAQGSLADRVLEFGYKGLTLLILVLAGIGLVTAILRFVEDLRHRTAAAFRGTQPWNFSAGLVLGMILAVGALAIVGILIMALSHLVFSPALTPAQRGLAALVILLPIPAVAGLVVLRRSDLRLDLDVAPGLQIWLLVTMIGFLSVSLLYIVLLNQTLDLQTLFIARVQFIQSHALYAIWLGFGLLLALAFLNDLFRRNAVMKYAAVLLALASPGLLVFQNYCNPDLIRIYGGAEQNGHDFGWQFGNWQLRGANGIREDLQATLSPEEFKKTWAAYPNPAYPPEMGTNAIFFGGTDPGRFVPTYMIYSAKVRPDVFLITQNALADNTYLNVMRDLYGDRIWIPSALDLNDAFAQYYREVQAGSDAGASLDMKQGRMTVQGVQGVMQINGILCRQMFDHEKDRHEFFIEESYVIPWMYPYLTPHGLIMKLNAQPTPLTDELVRNDRAFWDWYVARLMGDKKFQHDVVAQKTFSKLRGAIAGLYAARGRLAEAEYAYRQSVRLYPLSPEAHFRLCELFTQTGRYDEAIREIGDFLKEDPENDRVAAYLQHLQSVRESGRRWAELKTRAAAGPLTYDDAVELCTLNLRFGDMAGFERMFRNILGTTPPSRVLRQLVLGALSARRDDLAELALERYIAVEPDDLAALTELAAIRTQARKYESALGLLRAAVQRGGNAARERIHGDPRFTPLMNRPEFRALLTPPAGGPARSGVPDALRGLIR